MSKIVSIRLPDDVYKEVVKASKAEHRPVSNFITHAVMNAVANLFKVSDKEMKEILADKELLRDLEIGRQQYREGKGHFVE